jgi:glutamate N-acetyltransferase/amino-acid N-acetyltransferase
MTDFSKKSPLAPSEIIALSPLGGVMLASSATAMKYQDRKDLMLAYFPEGAEVAGVFTKSKCFSAPVGWCRDLLSGKTGKAKALLVNAGNANAFTGFAGDQAVAALAAALAVKLGCAENELYFASTGVIGEILPTQPIISHFEDLANGLSVHGWADAAAAIMTTDTFVKTACRTATLKGQLVTMNGFAKGSGMIAPDMATMLGFIFTDAAVSRDVLQNILAETTEISFNSITVDSDTSTSDTVLAFSTGQENKITDVNDPELDDFKAKFKELMLDLAHQIVKDGEGATKFIEITVTGAQDDSAAKKIALSVANSPLVKTAIAGGDANWGRIIMAVGKAGEEADRDAIKIVLGDQIVTKNGLVVADYDEEKSAQHFKSENIKIAVDVGIAAGKSVVWTCDLTHGYISINADYRS